MIVDSDPTNEALEAQIQNRIVAQLQRPMRLLFIVRMVGVAGIGLVFSYAMITAASPVWLVAPVVLGFVGILVWMARPLRMAFDISPTSLRITFVSIVVMQTLAIAITGGLQSPLLVVYVPSMILSAVLSGRWSVMGPAFGIATVSMAIFWAFDAFAPGTLPALHAELARVTLGVVVIAASAMGATAGMVIRRAFDDSVRAEATARADAIGMLRSRNVELKELGSALAHELKNPLAAIQGLTMQQLRNADEGSRDAERLAVVVSEVKRMSKVLEDFLTFSKPFSELERTDVELKGFIMNLMELYRDHLRSLQLGMLFAGDDDLVVSIDERQMKHVVVNLLLNAIDVSRPKDTLSFHIRREDNVAVIELWDCGPGLTEEASKRVFDAGYTTRPEGTGLGLAISRGIVRAHGGELTLTNRALGGCVARIELPMQVES